VIAPVQKDEVLRNDILASAPTTGFSLWWLGQSGFLLKARSGCILLDPYLSDSLTRRYAQTDRPHERMTELAIRPERLDMVDVVTSSHNHTDHLDADTLLPLRQANPQLKLIIPEANRQFVAARLGCDPQWPIGLTDGQSVQVGAFTIHGVASAHEQVDRDAQGRPLYLGYVVCFGGHSIYHPGDTVWHADLVPQLAAFDLSLALLPINGRLPERRVAGNLWGPEAATLARDIHARLVVPCHFDMFAFNTQSPDAFVARCCELGQAHRVLRCGERLDG
jgi:L-ascorbate metabolism protein UlaG (beta-lactamase superfamily)